MVTRAREGQKIVQDEKGPRTGPRGSPTSDAQERRATAWCVNDLTEPVTKPKKKKKNHQGNKCCVGEGNHALCGLALRGQVRVHCSLQREVGRHLRGLGWIGDKGLKNDEEVRRWKDGFQVKHRFLSVTRTGSERGPSKSVLETWFSRLPLKSLIYF